MSAVPHIEGVLVRYPWLGKCAARALGNAGGFSGAQLWKLQSEEATWCLRRWPRSHPDRDRLRFIHAVLRHAASRGLDILPCPLASHGGETFVEVDGNLWEVTPWLPGEANFHIDPSMEKLAAVMRSLATFHQHAETFELHRAPPPGIVARREQLDRLRLGDYTCIVRAVEQLPWPGLRARAARIFDCYERLAGGVLQDLTQAQLLRVAIHPCIRDIWHDHVLFEDCKVSGFVDFGALKLDHVAADISRLLGSLVRDDPRQRSLGLAAYQDINPLAAEDRWLIGVYDRGSVLLSGMNWLQWTAVEKREFEDRSRVLRRLDEILDRLEYVNG